MLGIRHAFGQLGFAFQGSMLTGAKVDRNCHAVRFTDVGDKPAPPVCSLSLPRLAFEDNSRIDASLRERSPVLYWLHMCPGSAHHPEINLAAQREPTARCWQVGFVLGCQRTGTD
jgi:hypothetical protein